MFASQAIDSQLQLQNLFKYGLHTLPTNGKIKQESKSLCSQMLVYVYMRMVWLRRIIWQNCSVQFRSVKQWPPG